MSMLKILRTSRALAVMAACIGIFALGVQQAQATSLDDLFLGGTITANDKLFDNWAFDSTFSSTGLTLSDIDVTALTDGGNDPGPGLLYSVANQALLAEPGASLQLLGFSFRVSTDPSQFLIKDNSLELTDFRLGGLFASISISEIVDDNDPPVSGDLASKLVFVKTTGGATLFAEADFSPQSPIFVRTEITLQVEGAPNDLAELRGFEQRFSQEQVSGPPGGVIPEPGTLSLLGIGLAGLALHQWRRKKWASQ